MSDIDSDQDFDDEIYSETEEDKFELNISKYIEIPLEEDPTSDSLTDAEVTELISMRIAQIENGSQIFTDTSGLTDTREMAIKELLDRKSPLLVRRIIYSDEEGNKYFVYKDPKKSAFNFELSNIPKSLNEIEKKIKELK